MDLPNPPKDNGIRSIIDKLAEFVARNGPEFESITKAKQQGNPKFGFLFGGDYYQYYQWRVNSEQTILKQQGSLSQAHISSGQNHIGPDATLPSAMQGNHWSNGPPQIQQQQQQQQHKQMSHSNLNEPPQGTIVNPSVIKAQIDAIHTIATLRDQIHQSELNLSAQQGVLMQQQQVQIDEAIAEAQAESLIKQADEMKMSIKKFDKILQPIIEQCTKDSISAGKNWILQQATEPSKCNVILQYLLKKALNIGAPFTQKLHLIYLVNDVLHHCVRKRLDDLKNNLENIVIPMFCSGQLQANEDQKAKLAKLLSLWESKANFFDACVISKLKSPLSSMQEYKTNLMNTYGAVVAAIPQSTNATFESYKLQHQKFIEHAAQQIAILETQKQNMEKQQQPQSHISHIPAHTNIIPHVMPNNVIEVNQPQPVVQHQPQQQQQHIQQQTHINSVNPFSNNGILNGTSRIDRVVQQPPMQVHQQQQQPQQNIANMHLPPPVQTNQSAFNNSNNSIDLASFQNPEPPASMFNNNIISPIQQQQPPPPPMQQPPPTQVQPTIPTDPSNFALPPPNFLIPDLSKPPPGFENPPAPDIVLVPEEVKPVAPFYELPAGLMVPLIRLEDYEYRPLDPEELRLPPPVPPTERLLSAVEMFYAPPRHDRPRDGEGWEKLALYEYYKVKNAARKTKEEEIAKGERERSRSPSPIVIESFRLSKIKKRHYRSKSRSRSRSPRSRSRSPPAAVEQHSPSSAKQTSASSIGGRKSREYSRRASRSISPSPVSNSSSSSSKRNRSERTDRDRERDRHPDRSSRDRIREASISPPPSFFGGAGAAYSKPADECIEESNKGHQMLMKMGWAGSGTGLGSHGQGIDKPISGGEVRDRQDQFKGVGLNLNDPFENFRKNKGAAFIHRMRCQRTVEEGEAPATEDVVQS